MSINIESLVVECGSKIWFWESHLVSDDRLTTSIFLILMLVGAEAPVQILG